MKSNFPLIFIVLAFGTFTAGAVVVPEGKQNCFRSGAYLPKVVFENLSKDKKDVWAGLEGSLVEVYDYAFIPIHQRVKGSCDVCFTLHGTTDLDGKTYEVKIVTEEGKDDTFVTHVLSRSEGGDWSFWYSNLKCRE